MPGREACSMTWMHNAGEQGAFFLARSPHLRVSRAFHLVSNEGRVAAEQRRASRLSRV